MAEDTMLFRSDVPIYTADGDITDITLSGDVVLSGNLYINSGSNIWITDDNGEKIPLVKQVKMKAKTKKKEPIDFTKVLTAILTKYLAIREGMLGVTSSIPAAKIGDIVKEINQLVEDHMKQPSKRRTKKEKSVIDNPFDKDKLLKRTLDEMHRRMKQSDGTTEWREDYSLPRNWPKHRTVKDNDAGYGDPLVLEDTPPAKIKY
jgi:hypothetical protein